MDKPMMLNMIRDHLNLKSDAEFADYLGIKPQRLSNWRMRNTMDYEVIYTKCGFINAEWLFDPDKTEMLKKDVRCVDQEEVPDDKGDYKEMLIREKERTISILLKGYEFKKDKEIADLKHRIDRLNNRLEALILAVEIDETFMEELVTEKSRKQP